jgi:hypothetical protein
MICPHCGAQAHDITESWHTLPEAEGAEYLATYVTIWCCSSCHTLVGTHQGDVEWIAEPQEALIEE